jgi:lysozyme family protein
MDIFDAKFLEPLLTREGGERYTNNPADKGGPTKWGITAVTLGEFRKLGRAARPAEVQALTRAEAVTIYRQNYWIKPGFANIAPISERIAEELLDTGVNMGTATPGPWFQRTLNALNRQGRDYADLPVTGFVGTMTAGALRSLIAKRGKAAAEDVVLKGLNGFQVVRYIELSEKRSANEEFTFGWLRTRVGF